jgi:hypothetical protein
MVGERRADTKQSPRRGNSANEVIPMAKKKLKSGKKLEETKPLRRK